MSFTYGFYNSKDHDRVYDARDFSRIFDGIINDGVYATIGDCFIVKALSGFTITVGTGRAWFNGTWSLNDSLLPITMPLPDVVRPRIDAVVLEVDTRDSVRTNSIKVIEGIPDTNPSYPLLTGEDGVYRHPLCYIRRKPNSIEIIQSDIENQVGFKETPFVTGIIDTIDPNELLIQWKVYLDDFVRAKTEEFLDWMKSQDEMASDFKGKSEEEYKNWLDSIQQTINIWFEDIKNTLDEDAVTNLYMKIRENDLEHVITVGFADGKKVFSDDGLSIESVASDGRRLIKTFNSDFSRVVTILKSSDGSIIATQTKEFSSDGKTINSEVTYM